MEQLLIWQVPMTDEILLQQEIKNLKIRQDNLRRGLFARLDVLTKEITEIRQKFIETPDIIALNHENKTDKEILEI